MRIVLPTESDILQLQSLGQVCHSSSGYEFQELGRLNLSPSPPVDNASTMTIISRKRENYPNCFVLCRTVIHNDMHTHI